MAALQAVWDSILLVYLLTDQERLHLQTLHIYPHTSLVHPQYPAVVQDTQT
jgi:hypothetical protein